MQGKIKNIIIILEFIAILSVVLVLNIIKQDEKISISERRKLAQFPEITINTIFSGDASENFEKYATDQFTKRDFFREIKYWFSMNILKQQDNNKLFVKNDSVYKMEYPLNETAIEKSSQKIQNVCQKYLQGMNIYYSLIPDKNYYLEDEHLKMDYSKIEEIMENNLENAKYIDIKSLLNTESFYKTDLHWKQEKILDVANKIKENMNLKLNNTQYEEVEVGNFYGVYYGQAGTSIKPDKIKYLTNDTIENCITYNYETEKEGKVYDLERYKTSSDKYDIFLSGATAVISIKNPNANTDKELLIFRDSFGSSLAPLMLEDYKDIILIDLRYINSTLLDQYIDFKNQDVLILYSGVVLNQNILK